jgi:hypothetical protein
MKFDKRVIHRDLGYFYVGLIISFAISGMMMNHRNQWHPEKYVIEKSSFQISPLEESQINDSVVQEIVKANGINDKFRRQSVKKGELRISLERTDIDIDLKTGAAEVTSFINTPVISQLMRLHKNTSNWWIYYGDIFALSLITIALTGTTLLAKSKNSFRRRGWKLALAGVIFPLLVLLLLS